MFYCLSSVFWDSQPVAITSEFNSKLHPTISNVSILDSETIAYFIKQSKTDQETCGQNIYICNLPSQIQTYQALFSYFQLRNVFCSKKYLKLILAQSGLTWSNKKFDNNKFQTLIPDYIGVPITAAQKGLSQYQIQGPFKICTSFFNYIVYLGNRRLSFPVQ